MSWQVTNTGTAGQAATVTISASAAATSGGQVIRLRALQGTLAGVSAGHDQMVVRDGNSGSGTIIWSAELSVVVNGGFTVPAGNIDLRASPGNNMTVEFVSGVTGDIETVNAQGDLVPNGYPYGFG